MTKNKESLLQPYFAKCFVEGRLPELNRSEPLLVGFSARNRAFSRAFFESAMAVSDLYFARLEILVVDLPYAYNDAARRGASQPSEEDIAKSLRTGEERLRMVRKVASAHRGRSPINVRRWSDVVDCETVRDLRAELKRAFDRRGNVFEKLIYYSNLWAHGSEGDARDNYTSFLIEEFPVFIKLYYEDRLLADLYPGPNFSFFSELEASAFADELSMATEVAAGKRLCFLNVGYEFSMV